jgi:O-antigen/teichoic acid export membrane protein
VYLCPIKSLSANISLVVLLNALVKPAWLLMEMLVQDEVGHESWGLYAALLAFGFVFLTFSDLGINQYTTKTLASEPQLLKSYFPNLLTVKMLLTLFYPLLMLGLGWLIGYRGEELWFLALLALMWGGTQLMAFFRSNFRAMQRFTLDSWLSVFDRLVLLGVVGFLLYRGIDIEAFIFARLAVVGVASLFFYFLLTRLYGWFRPRFNPPLIKKVVRLSWALGLITILYSLHDKVDQVMLERLYSEEENGLYVGAYRWLDAFSMYLWIILPFFFARFAYFIHQKQEQQRLLNFGQVITALPLMFISVFVFFYGELLLFPFENSSPEELLKMENCLLPLFITVLVNSVFAIFSTLLTSTGYERPVNLMIITSIALNIVLNYIFIPTYGALAAAWTTVASYGLIDLLYLFYVQFKTDIQVPYGQMARLLVAGGVLALCFGLLQQTALPWYGVSLVAGSVYLGVAYGLKLVSWRMLKQF